MANKSDNILEITVDRTHRVTFKSPNGSVESGVLLDIQRIIGNMVREAPVPLPKEPDPNSPQVPAAENVSA